MATATKTTRNAGKTKVSRTKKAASKPAATPVATPTAAPISAPVSVPQSSIPVSDQLHPGLQPITADEFVQRFEALSGQERSAKLMQKRGDVDIAYAQAQGKAIQSQVEHAKNLVTAEGINTQTARLAYAQTQTQLEQVKVQSLQIDVAGQSALLPHQQQAWDIKEQEMVIDNQGAANLLEPRRQHWSLKLQLAQTELQRLQQTVQIKQSEMNAANIIDAQVIG